jgi:hypothetical protein
MLVTVFIIFLILIFFSVGGYFGWIYFNKDDSTVVSDSDRITNTGDGTVIAKIKKIEGGKTEIFTNNKYEELELNRPYLLKQTGLKPCIYGETYGLDTVSNTNSINGPDSKMFVSDGCSGVFYVKSENSTVGFCQSDSNRETCYMNKIAPMEDTLSGLDTIKNITVVKDLSDGKCKNNAVITDGKLYVSNGCKGYFKVGALQGYCHSEIGKTKECYFGKTEKISDDFPYAGLRSFPIIYLGDNAQCEDFDPGEVKAPTWGLLSDNKMFAQYGCSGQFKWGYYQGNCSSTGNEKVQCKIGSESDDNLSPFV